MFTIRRLKLGMFLCALIFALFLVLTPSHNKVPEPGPVHIGLAAGSLSYLSGEVPLGKIRSDLLRKTQSLYTVDPSLFFWPNDLQDHVFFTGEGPHELLDSPLAALSLLYTLAFILFGSSLSAVIVLWATLFLLGVGLSLLLPLNRSSVQALSIVLAFTILTISILPFLEVNSFSVINLRVLPLLIVVPVAALVLLLMSGKPVPLIALPIGLLIGYVIVSRASAAWTIVTLCIAGLASVWRLRGRQFVGRTAGVIALTISVGAPILLLPSAIPGTATKQNLPATAYNDTINPANSLRWISINLGLFADPRLFESYVCTEEPPVTDVNGISHLPCSSEEISTLRALIMAADPRNAYDDQRGYNAALRFTDEKNFEVDLALPPMEFYGNLTQFNMNWTELGNVSKSIVIEVLQNDGAIVAQNVALVKPIRLFFSLIEQPKLIAISVIRGSSPAPLFLPLLLVSAILFISARDILRFNRDNASNREIHKQVRTVGQALGLLAVTSSIPGIIFYSMSHTVLDIGILFSSLLAFMTLQYFVKRSQSLRL